MQDYTTILGVIELRMNNVSYDDIRKRYRLGNIGITLIMNLFKDSGLSLTNLKQMAPKKLLT